MKNYKTIIAAVVAGLACTAATSQASVTSLPTSGGVATPPPGDSIYGTQLASQVSTFNNGLGVTGTLDSWVYSGVGAPGGVLGGLEFVYQIINGASPASTLEHLVLNGYSGIPIQVAITPGGGTIQPQTASRLPGSDLVTWDFTFPNQIPPSATSYDLIIYTSLTGWTHNVATIQDGSAANQINILAPVPEPSTVVAGALMLLPFGIGAIRSLRKDRTA